MFWRSIHNRRLCRRFKEKPAASWLRAVFPAPLRCDKLIFA
jgi:hypothetical protein